MNNKVKVTGLLLGGYLLGRSKKLKLAMTVAASVSGSALYRNRDQIQETLSTLGGSSTELQELRDKVTGRVVDLASAKLQEQTDKITSALDDAGGAADSAKDSAEEEASQDAEGAGAEAEEVAGLLVFADLLDRLHRELVGVFRFVEIQRSVKIGCKYFFHTTKSSFTEGFRFQMVMSTLSLFV